MNRTCDLGFGLPPACRLGLATRGNTHLDPNDIYYAIERGVNYLNWCGHVDGLSQAIRGMGKQRDRVIVAWQIQSGTADAARRELDKALSELATDRIDLVTLYYVESEREWISLASEGGAYEALAEAKKAGQIRMIGLTSHQRSMAARIVSGDIPPPADRLDSDRPLDALMLRYNAAHRGAERDVFPTTDEIRLPVIVYTCLRWGALMESTPSDPSGYIPPRAPEWYRYALANPSVSIALMAPDGRAELDENLSLLDDWRDPTPAEMDTMQRHGDRVYKTAGSFP
jgi:aryl-alcohol dehydrogenase-like predicted oxidoreductase